MLDKGYQAPTAQPMTAQQNITSLIPPPLNTTFSIPPLHNTIFNPIDYSNTSLGLTPAEQEAKAQEQRQIMLDESIGDQEKLFNNIADYIGINAVQKWLNEQSGIVKEAYRESFDYGSGTLGNYLINRRQHDITNAQLNTTQGFEDLGKEYTDIETNITRFDKMQDDFLLKYPSNKYPEGIPEEEWETYELGYQSIEKELNVLNPAIDKYNKRLENLETRQKNIDEAQKLINKEKNSSINYLGGTFVGELVSTPLSLASTGIEFAKRPVSTIEMMIKSGGQTSKKFAETPFLTSVEIVAQILGSITVAKGISNSANALFRKELRLDSIKREEINLTSIEGDTMKFIKETPIQKPRQISSATQQPVVSELGEVSLGKFKETAIIPEQYGTISSRVGRLFFEPTQVIIREGKIINASTPNIVIARLKESLTGQIVVTDPYLIKIAREGAKSAEFDISRSAAKELDNFNPVLTAEQKRALYSNGEGVYYPETAKIYSGDTITFKFLRETPISSKRLNIRFYKNNRINKQTGVTISKPVLSTSEFEILKSMSKSINLGGRKVTTQTGLTKVYKEPIDLTPEQMDIGFRGGGKRSSNTYLQNLYKDSAQLQSEIKNVLSKRVMNEASRTSNYVPKNIRIMLEPKINFGGTAPAISRFFGRGLYERTEGAGAMPMQTRLKTISNVNFRNIIKERLDSINQNRKKLSNGILMLSKVKANNILGQLTLNINKNNNILGQPTLNINKNNNILNNVSRNIFREAQREQQVERMRERLKQVTINVPIIITPKLGIQPKNPSPKEPKRFIFRYGKPETEDYARKIEKAYAVLIKRRGKYIPIASGLPRGKALAFGSSRTIRELARSFKIKEMGTTTDIDINFMPNQNIFRDYKVRRGRSIPVQNEFIQRQRKSLLTSDERKLIQLAKLFK